MVARGCAWLLFLESHTLVSFCFLLNHSPGNLSWCAVENSFSATNSVFMFLASYTYSSLSSWLELVAAGPQFQLSADSGEPLACGWGERKHSYEEGQHHCISVLLLLWRHLHPSHPTALAGPLNSAVSRHGPLHYGAPSQPLCIFNRVPNPIWETRRRSWEKHSCDLCYLMSGAYSLFAPHLGFSCPSALRDTFQKSNTAGPETAVNFLRNCSILLDL